MVKFLASACESEQSHRWSMHHSLGVLFIGTEEQENAKTNRADFFRKLATLPGGTGPRSGAPVLSYGLVKLNQKEDAPTLAEGKQNRGHSCLFRRACRKACPTAERTAQGFLWILFCFPETVVESHSCAARPKTSKALMAAFS